MRIDLLSPLPPVRSGISDYTVDLLPHLRQHAEVRPVALPGQPVAEGVVERFRPIPWGELPSEPGAGDPLPLYQMGNNRHHRAVLERALAFPGVLTLHDLVLHHLLLDLTLGPDGIGGDAGLEHYVERLGADHGWMGERIARAKLWGAYGAAPTFALPAHRTLLRRQRGVLVHSRWAAEAVRRDDPEVRVRAVPMGVPLPAAADPRRGLEMRRRLGIPEGAPVVGCFGFQTPIKRTLSTVAALAAAGLEEAHLLVVGEVSPALGLEAAARQAGVAGRVHVTGFVEFSDFEAALAAADLAVNLRYPTAGETSASLLRILAAGRPAVVSEYAQFAELPASLVPRVPLGDGEVPALAAVLRELMADRERLTRLAEESRQWIRERHDPRASAARIAEACRDWAEVEPPGDAPPTLLPPTSRTWARLAGELAVSSGELEPWPPGERRHLPLTLVNHGPATWLAGRRGPGGVALQVRLETPAGDLEAARPWLPLPRDLPAGESLEVGIPVRRPPGPARLVIEPHVLGGRGGAGGAGFGSLGGPVWRCRWGDRQGDLQGDPQGDPQARDRGEP